MHIPSFLTDVQLGIKQESFWCVVFVSLDQMIHFSQYLSSVQWQQTESKRKSHRGAQMKSVLIPPAGEYEHWNKCSLSVAVRCSFHQLSQVWYFLYMHTQILKQYFAYRNLRLKLVIKKRDMIDFHKCCCKWFWNLTSDSVTLCYFESLELELDNTTQGPLS